MNTAQQGKLAKQGRTSERGCRGSTELAEVRQCRSQSPELPR